MLLFQDPRAVAHKRAVKLRESYIEPRAWSAEDVLWVIGKLAIEYHLAPGSVQQACINAKPGPELQSEQYIDRQTKQASKEIGSQLAIHTNSAFAAYLRRVDAALLADLVPADTRKLLISRWVAKLQAVWSPNRCAIIKGTIGLSNANWTWLRQLLGRMVNSDGKVVDLKLDDVTVPLLCGRFTLDKTGNALSAHAGLSKEYTASHGGLSAIVCAKRMLHMMVRKELRGLSSNDITILLQKRHTLKWSCDAAPAGKLNFSQICLTLNPEKKMGGSPANVRVPALFHGKEDAKSVWHFAGPVMEVLEEIFHAGEISVPLSDEPPHSEVTLKFKAVPQADAKGKSSAFMHMAFTASHGCFRCELPTKKFLETSTRAMQLYGGDVKRTIENIKLHAHLTVTDKCQGCGMAVVATREEMDTANRGIKNKRKWKAIVVCIGDPVVDEPQPWAKKTVNGQVWEWQRRHKSIYYGGLGYKLMFPRIQPSEWPTCTLHLRQRTTNLDVRVGICQFLDRDWNKKKKKAAKDGNHEELDGPQTTMLAAMFECMMAKGKKIPFLKEPKTVLTKSMSGRLLGIATRNWEGIIYINIFYKYIVACVRMCRMCVCVCMCM